MKKLGALILGAILTIGIGAGISVNPKTDVAHAASIETVYELVADASTLAANDVVIITNSDATKAMSTTQNKNNRGVKDVSKSGNYISDVTDVQLLTLEAGNKAGTFAFNTGSGYLYAASSSNNYLRTETDLSDNSSWKITIADGVATIKAQGTNTKNWLRYNSSSGLFSCYSSGQQDINLYRKTTIEIEEGAVTSLTLNSTQETIIVGESCTLTATVNEDANDKSITWSSSDETIATVEEGVVSALKRGYVEITATSSNAEIFATCAIGVTENAGTEADPLNVLDATLLGNNGFLSDYYYIEGTVKEITISTTATGYITDGTNDLYVYKIYDTGSNVEFSDTTKVKVGDDVVIYSKLGNYKGTPQAQYGWFTSIVSNVTLSSISLSGDIASEHYIDEGWNLSGLTVTATYSDASTLDVTSVSTITVNPEAPEVTGEQVITITAEYNGKTTSKEYTVTVLAAIAKITDTITYETLGYTDETGYSDVSFSATSNALYKANSYVQNYGYMQFNKATSGIISTTLAGYRLRGVEILFNSKTSSGSRSVDVYCSNTAYDVISEATTTNVANIAYNGETTAVKALITGDYKYVSIKPIGGAVYIDSISFVWEAFTAENVSREISTLAGGWNNHVATENCATNYATAKEMILSLSTEESEIFQTSSDVDIASARATYENWCHFNGDNSPYEGAIVDASNIALTVNNNNVVTIVIILGAVLALAATLMLISKKRKLAK